MRRSLWAKARTFYRSPRPYAQNDTLINPRRLESATAVSVAQRSLQRVDLPINQQARNAFCLQMRRGLLQHLTIRQLNNPLRAGV